MASNRAADPLADFARSAIWEPLVRFAFDRLVKEVAFLAWPVVNPIAWWLFSMVGGVIFRFAHLFVDLSSIRIIDERVHRRFTISHIRLKQVLEQYGAGSREFREAKVDAQQDFQAFVRINWDSSTLH